MNTANIFASVFLITFFAIFLSIYLMMHFVEAKGLYTIAKRRGIPHPVYAYIPIFKRYVIAKLAEQFECAQYGKTRNHTLRILGFGIPADIATLLYALIMIVMANTIYGVELYGSYIASSYLILYSISFLIAGLIYPAYIFTTIAYYKIFRSLDPDTCTLFTILHLALGVTTPFVLLKKRDMDNGFIELKNRYI